MYDVTSRPAETGTAYANWKLSCLGAHPPDASYANENRSPEAMCSLDPNDPAHGSQLAVPLPRPTQPAYPPPPGSPRKRNGVCDMLIKYMPCTYGV